MHSTWFVTFCESTSGTSVFCGEVPQIMYIRCLRSAWAWTRVPLDGLIHDLLLIMEHNAQQAQKEKIMEEHNAQPSKDTTSRRSFLRKGIALGGAGTLGAGLLAGGFSLPAFAEKESGGLTQGDVAILRLLAAVEIIESDLWQQYNELGGIQDSEVPGGSGSALSPRHFFCDRKVYLES